MPGLPFPFKSFDCRKIGKEYRPRIIKGLEKKIFDSKNQIIEDNFPIGLNIKLNGENINAKIYVFKTDAGEKDQKELRNWKGNASIIYTNNGQTQHLRDHTVFNKKEFKKIRYIAKYIFITVDCSELSHLTKSDLFMSDRERVKQSKTYQKIENELTKLVSENNELRKIALERIEKDRSNKIKDSSDIETIFQDLVKQDQDLVKLFQDGLKGFLNPFSFGSGKKIKAYEGKRFPTQFKLAKQFTVQTPKKCLIDDDRYKIFFKTDAVNDYFDRDISPGSFSLKINGIETENYSTSLINGRFTLTLKLDDSKKLNDKLYCEVTITDETRIEPFRENNFHMIIVSGKSKSSKGFKKPVKPTAPGDGNDKDKNHLELPFHIDPV